MLRKIIDVNPKHYQRHLIHGENRTWAETNCYVDLWVELLHAQGFDPVAGLPFTVAIDFEGDQWTFFKYPISDLYDLYGLDVQELAIWRPLTEQVDEQVNLGRPVLVELDSFYLPDTAGTAYQLAHVKTTVAITEIDLENNHMGYFHNQGYFHLDGDDFRNIFHLNTEIDPTILSPYVEFVKNRRHKKLQDKELLDLSLRLLSKHLQLAPSTNPFTKFKNRFEEDLEWLMNEGLETFHHYSFATLRQYGACYELFTTYLKWLIENGVDDLEEPLTAFTDISNNAKTLQFQLARAISRKKQLDLSALDTMGNCWESGISSLKKHYG